MNNATRYTTIGNVRGSCDHDHKSLEAAVKCAAKDQRICKKLGGYSDRNVRYINGDKLDDEDFQRMRSLESR